MTYYGPLGILRWENCKVATTGEKVTVNDRSIGFIPLYLSEAECQHDYPKSEVLAFDLVQKDQTP